MTVFVKKYQNTNRKSKAFGKTYARTVMIGTVGINELSAEISETCTVTRHDIIAVLSALGPAMSRMLQSSVRVKLPYLGTFKLGVNTEGEENEEDFNVMHNVKGIHVLFHPETQVNAQGNWENELTRGSKIAELPKDYKVKPASGDTGDDEGGNAGGDNTPSQEDAGEDRP
jgi:predicted histone-like DNA-binding protein